MSEAVAVKEALLFWVSQSKSVFRQRETDTRAHRLSRRRLRFQSLDTRNRFLLSDRGICAFAFNVIACFKLLRSVNFSRPIFDVGTF